MILLVYRIVVFLSSILLAMFIPAVLILLALAPDWMPTCLDEVRENLADAFDASTKDIIEEDL